MDKNKAENVRIEEIKKLFEEYQNKKPAPCPSCGHCPTCGNNPYRFAPMYPVNPYWVQPAYPWYTNPVITYTSTTAVVDTQSPAFISITNS